jgi:hypothetical protein
MAILILLEGLGVPCYTRDYCYSTCRAQSYPQAGHLFFGCWWLYNAANGQGRGR